jgi:hypothetical protein
MSTEKITGLALLRAPFQPHQISKLPKPTKKQTEDVRNDFKLGIRCTLCGAWHHKDVIHLDYVGHAALTDRLLDADQAWSWEPLAMDAGLPSRDEQGGLWIKLTVCNVTRLGYGHAGDKTGGDAIKEIIGDALRNAAMRFGAALDLWHKGELHLPDEEPKKEKVATVTGEVKTAKPKATPEEAKRGGELRAMFMRIGGEGYTSSVFKKMAYDTPADMIKVLEATLRNWSIDQQLEATKHAEWFDEAQATATLNQEAARWNWAVPSDVLDAMEALKAKCG